MADHKTDHERDSEVTDQVDDKTVDATVHAVGDKEKDHQNYTEYFDDDYVIVTGADAAKRLLPLRDDFDPAVTFRSMFLATIFCCFQAVMNQIYMFKPSGGGVTGTFILIVSHFLGKAWAAFLPRGDLLEAKWRGQGGQGKPPFWIRAFVFINPGPWGLKEHAITSITASAASEASAATEVFAAQMLFYDMPVSILNAILNTISIGLFGYGIAGLIRPIAVWHVEAVFWTCIPMIKMLQSLHWDTLKDSKPLRFFWYAFGSMFAYEWLPAYVWPWLNSVSIPCLASSKATGERGQTLTKIFGGATNNEGMGLLSFSFDWQYLTSAATSLPLKLLVHSTVGYVICFFAMSGIYWGNVWGSKDLPFMSTNLRSQNGSRYPTASVFVDGVLDKAVLDKLGLPRIAGSFVYATLTACCAIGALFAHCILFWSGDVVRSYKAAKEKKFDDPHHEHISKHYKEVSWMWYAVVLGLSFILGLIVVVKDNISISVWSYIVALLLGILVAPFSTLLFSRFGNGIATNNLSKMLAGFILPGHAVGNLYFAAWSHNVISSCVDLCGSLKMGEYLKIPPRAMFLTQIYGTVIGGFINFVVMRSIVTRNKELLADGDGNASWSGAAMQSYNTKAASWALSSRLFSLHGPYAIVMWGLAIGAGLVLVHRLVLFAVPPGRLGRVFDRCINELNIPQLISYCGVIPVGGSQTCVLLSSTLIGFFSQFYLRNYRPRIFRDYMYLVTAAWDGASVVVLFILSFALLGAGPITVPMPSWWGNNINGYYDHCPYEE